MGGLEVHQGAFFAQTSCQHAVAGGGVVEEEDVRREVESVKEGRGLVPASEELPAREPAAPGGADAGAEDVVAVPVLLVDTSEGGRASVGGVAHVRAVASVPQEVAGEPETLRAVVETGNGEDPLPEVGEHGHHIAASAPNFLEDTSFVEHTLP